MFSLWFFIHRGSEVTQVSDAGTCIVNIWMCTSQNKRWTLFDVCLRWFARWILSTNINCFPFINVRMFWNELLKWCTDISPRSSIVCILISLFFNALLCLLRVFTFLIITKLLIWANVWWNVHDYESILILLDASDACLINLGNFAVEANMRLGK